MDARETLLQGLTEDEVGVVFFLLDAAGYAVVPKEPTREMLHALYNALGIKADRLAPVEINKAAEVLSAYRAMLSAALSREPSP